MWGTRGQVQSISPTWSEELVSTHWLHYQIPSAPSTVFAQHPSWPCSPHELRVSSRSSWAHRGQGKDGDNQEKPRRPHIRDVTCTKEDDLVLQRQVGEVGDALGPLHQCEELLVSGVADVGDGVVCLTEQQHPRERAQEKGRIGQCKITDSSSTSCSIKSS